MLTYNTREWAEASRRGDGSRHALFSTANAFRMDRESSRRLHVASAELPESRVHLLRVLSSGHEIDLIDEAYLTLMLPVTGRTKVRIGREDHVIREGQSLAFWPSERWTQVKRGAHRFFRAHLVKIPVSAARHAALATQNSVNPVSPVSSKALDGFNGLLRYAFADLASSRPTLVQRPASDLFAALVLEHLRTLLDTQTDPSSAGCADQALVRSAEEYMSAHLGDPLTVPVIAGALGVSVRHLQDIFRKTAGVSPWERLTELRLQEARVRLLAGTGDRVSDTAFDCGFSHLGRFAQKYRATFGEAPVDTFRRAKAGPRAIRTGLPQIG